jgi:trk system potassium uptake protein TrkA
MYIVINGAGKVGSHLCEILASAGHSVAVIDKREDVGERMAEQGKLLVIHGDGCDIRSLEDAGIKKADVFAAVTGDDDDNLVSCQLAKTSYGVPRTVARVNSPKNEHIFYQLGIEGISSTTVISQLIQEEATVGDILTLYTLKKGKLALVEVELPTDKCKVCDVPVKDLNLPEKCVLVSILRDNAILIPTADTKLKPGDSVIAVTNIEQENKLKEALIG